MVEPRDGGDGRSDDAVYPFPTRRLSHCHHFFGSTRRRCNYIRFLGLVLKKSGDVVVELGPTLRCVPAIAAAIAIALPQARGDDAAATGQYDQLVQQLDSPVYADRRSAFRILLELGSDSDKSVSLAARRAVHRGIRSASVEVRLASGDLLKRLEFHQQEVQVWRLRDPRVPSERIEIESWHSFAESAGSNMIARRFFADAYQRFPGLLQREPSKSITWRRVDRMIPSEDTVGWGVLIWCDLNSNTSNSPLSSQIANALADSGWGPTIDTHPHSRILRRLIAAWLESIPPNASPVSQRMRIAMRYNLDEISHRLIEEVFSDDRAWPESRMAALLCSCALGRDDLVARATQCLDDGRTGCVWKLITSDRIRIRTQVRDVALVVLLQHRGIDPRSAGFEYLEADPLLLFRDHSLGFSNDIARRQAHAKAQDLMQRIETLP